MTSGNFFELAIHESSHSILLEKLGGTTGKIEILPGQPGRVYFAMPAGLPAGDVAIVSAAGAVAEGRFTRQDPYQLISRPDLAILESAALSAGASADQFASFLRDAVAMASKIIWTPAVWRQIVAGAEAIGEAGGRICFTETAPRQPTVSPRAARMRKAMDTLWAGPGAIYP